MDREFWKIRRFNNNDVPEYTCPKCGQGKLKLKTKNEIITKNGQVMSDDNYPYGIEHSMSGVFLCSRVRCKEPVSFVGKAEKDIEQPLYDFNGEYKGERLFHSYSIKYFYPNLKLFPVTEDLSEELRNELNASFAHFFSDLSSCANKVRTSIEVMLNDLKAPKYKIKSNGDRHYFKTLHGRIENYKKKNKTISEMLLAIKIIGNEGSHYGAVELEDVLDAYEILEQVIEACFVKRKDKAIRLARSINQNNKPRSKS